MTKQETIINNYKYIFDKIELYKTSDADLIKTCKKLFVCNKDLSTEELKNYETSTDELENKNKIIIEIIVLKFILSIDPKLKTNRIFMYSNSYNTLVDSICTNIKFKQIKQWSEARKEIKDQIHILTESFLSIDIDSDIISSLLIKFFMNKADPAIRTCIKYYTENNIAIFASTDQRSFEFIPQIIAFIFTNMKKNSKDMKCPCVDQENELNEIKTKKIYNLFSKCNVYKKILIHDKVNENHQYNYELLQKTLKFNTNHIDRIVQEMCTLIAKLTPKKYNFSDHMSNDENWKMYGIIVGYYQLNEILNEQYADINTDDYKEWIKNKPPLIDYKEYDLIETYKSMEKLYENPQKLIDQYPSNFSVNQLAHRVILNGECNKFFNSYVFIDIISTDSNNISKKYIDSDNMFKTYELMIRKTSDILRYRLMEWNAFNNQKHKLEYTPKEEKIIAQLEQMMLFAGLNYMIKDIKTNNIPDYIECRKFIQTLIEKNKLEMETNNKEQSKNTKSKKKKKTTNILKSINSDQSILIERNITKLDSESKESTISKLETIITKEPITEVELINVKELLPKVESMDATEVESTIITETITEVKQESIPEIESTIATEPMTEVKQESTITTKTEVESIDVTETMNEVESIDVTEPISEVKQEESTIPVEQIGEVKPVVTTKQEPIAETNDNQKSIMRWAIAALILLGLALLFGFMLYFI